MLLVINSRSRSLRSSSPKYKVQTYNTAIHGGQWPGAINVTSVLAGGAACTHGARGSGHSRCVHSPLACLRACATPHPRLEHRHPPPPCLLAALSLLPLSLHHGNCCWMQMQVCVSTVLAPARRACWYSPQLRADAHPGSSSGYGATGAKYWACTGGTGPGGCGEHISAAPPPPPAARRN